MILNTCRQTIKECQTTRTELETTEQHFQWNAPPVSLHNIIWYNFSAVGSASFIIQRREGGPEPRSAVQNMSSGASESNLEVLPVLLNSRAGFFRANFRALAHAACFWRLQSRRAGPAS